MAKNARMMKFGEAYQVKNSKAKIVQGTPVKLSLKIFILCTGSKTRKPDNMEKNQGQPTLKGSFKDL